MNYGLVIMVLVAYLMNRHMFQIKKKQPIELVLVGVLWPDDRNQKQINK